jgi:hypothetical protein
MVFQETYKLSLTIIITLLFTCNPFLCQLYRNTSSIKVKKDHSFYKSTVVQAQN